MPSKLKSIVYSRHHVWWLVLLLAGCGFHLRSYNFEGAVESFAITGKTRVGIAQPLRRSLKQVGVEERPEGDAALIVDLLDQRNERRSISTGGGTRAAEYEISYAVQYRILDSADNELAAPTWIERQRVYRIDSDNIVGSSEEQALLERELTQDVVGQIIRAMDAVSRNLTVDAS
jgi:LPS-assembly lipoprotein